VKYVPAFCWYAEVYYKLGNYEKSAEIALDLEKRARNTKDYENCIPPAINTLYTKAIRASGAPFSSFKGKRQFYYS
jgi:hypothetical protein